MNTISSKYLSPGSEVLSLLAGCSPVSMRKYASSHSGVEVCGDDKSLRIIAKGWVMDSPRSTVGPSLWIRPTVGECWVLYNQQAGKLEWQDYDDPQVWHQADFDA